MGDLEIAGGKLAGIRCEMRMVVDDLRKVS